MIPLLLAGPLLLETTVATEARYPVVGKVEVTTVSRSVVEIRQVDGVYQQRLRLCDVDITNRPGLTSTTIPQSFVQSMPERVVQVDIEGSGETWKYTADLGETWVGADPSIAAGSLPTDAEARSVLDHEGDGHPGATVQVRAPFVGEMSMYVARVAHEKISGTWADGVFTGPLQLLRHEQNLLGSSHPRLASDIDEVWKPEGSGFVLRPLREGECARQVEALGL